MGERVQQRGEALPALGAVLRMTINSHSNTTERNPRLHPEFHPSFTSPAEHRTAAAPGELQVPAKQLSPPNADPQCSHPTSQHAARCSWEGPESCSAPPAPSACRAALRTTATPSSSTFLLVCTSYTVYNKVNQLHTVFASVCDILHINTAL